MQPEPAGVVHDLGFRSYDGPRLGRRHARRAVARDALRGAWGLSRSARSRIVPFALLAVVLLPAFVAVATTAALGGQELPITSGEYLFALQVVVVLFVGAQAPAVVSRDLRFRLTALQFSRPLRPADWVHAKAAGMVAAVALLMAAPVTLMLLGSWLVGVDAVDALQEWARAVGAVVLYAVVLSAVSLLVAALVPRRGLGVAAAVSVLLLTSGVQVVVADALGPDALWSSLVSPSALADGIAAAWLGTDSGLPAPERGADVVFLLVYLAVVAGCYAGLRSRIRKVASS